MKTKFLLFYLLLSLNMVWGQINVPFISQSKAGCGSTGFVNSFCGHTSMEMIFSYYENRTPSSQNIFTYNYNIESNYNLTHKNCGTGTPDPNRLIWLAQEKGYNALWYGSQSYQNSSGILNQLSQLESYLNQGIPVMVQVGFGHYSNPNYIDNSPQAHWMILLDIDYTNQKVIMNDPGKSQGNQVNYSLQSFIDSWNNSFNICLIVFPNDKPINGGLDIYAGTPTSAGYNNVKLWCYPPNMQATIGAVNGISDFKINGNPKSITPSNLSYSNGKLQFNISFNNAVTNMNAGPMDFEFTVNYNNTSGQSVSQKFFGTKQLYYLQVANFTDVLNSTNNYSYDAINKGVKNGLFKGTNQNGTWMFLPNDNLTKGQACKIIVSTLFRLNMIQGINTSGTVPAILANQTDQEMYKYAMTLYNLNSANLPNNGTFNLTDNIKVEEFASMIFTALEVPTTSNLSNKISNISYTASNPAYQLRMQYVGRIGVPMIDSNNNVISTKPLASFLPFTTSSNGINNVNGSENIKRSTMAIFLTNAFLWKASVINSDTDQNNNTTVYRTLQNSTSVNTVTSTISDIKVIGDIPESSNTPTGNAPALNTTLQSNYVITDNQTLTLSHPSSFDSANNSSPLYFYWTANGGQSFVNLVSNYRSVKFTPNTVSAPTTYTIYSLVGNANGMIREYWISVTVNPSSGGSGNPTGAPTTQANTLQLYGATANSISASWTRGNGQKCIAVCYPVSANAQDTPSSGVLYSGNTNFQSAPFVFAGSDTKVVYTGTGNSCTITGLDSNTQYRVSILEYNGTSNGNIYYNYNNIPTATLSTLLPVNQQVVSNFAVSQANLLPSTNYQINNTTTGADTYSWSCIPSATFSDPNSFNTSINFPASGSYTIRLDASNSQTGSSVYAYNTVYVNNLSDLYPDFQPTNTAVSTSNVVANSNVTLNFGISNNGTGYVSNGQMFVSIYLSKDQTIDANDFLFTGANNLQIVDTFSANSVYPINPPLNLYIGDQSIYVNNGPGQYYIIIKVDSQSLIQETNETNNIINIPITIQAAYPNPYVQNITMPSTVASSQVINITTTLNNSGYTDATIFSLNYFLSYDNILSSDDIDLGFSMSSNVYPNSPLNINKTLTLPATLANGTYYLIAGDTNLCQNDFDKNNNSFAKQFTVLNPASQPTIQASNITVTNITSNSMSVSWTNGNGANRAVVIRETTPLNYVGNYSNGSTEMIKDGIVYNANSDFSQAEAITFLNTTNYPKVVYYGNSSIANITGLNPNKTYYINVYEANGSGASVDYLQANPLKYVVVKTENTNPTNNSWQTVLSDIYIDDVQILNNLYIINNAGNGPGTSTDSRVWYFKNNRVNNVIKSYYINDSKSIIINSDSGVSKVKFSNDGGQSYSNVFTLGQINGGYYDINFVNDNIGFISFGNAPNNGLILKTTNGGLTWAQIFSTFDTLNKIYFINDQVGFASSYSKLYKTINGGNSWTIIPYTINCNYYVSGIFFKNENLGWVSTECGKIYKTTNGGNSWTLVNVINSIATNDFTFVNENKGYFLGLNNNLGISEDGGLNWNFSTFTNNQNYHTPTIASKGVNEIWIGNNALYKTTTAGQTNAITLNSLSQNSYCTGNTINLSYNITGNYQTNESFIVDVSDSSGSFTNALTLATITNTGQGNISVILPHTLTNGIYSFRIKNSDGSLISNLLTNIIINQANTPSVTISGSNNICQGNSTTFIASGSYLGNDLVYQWYVNNIPVGSNSSTFISNTLSANDIVSLKVTSNDTCITQQEVFSNLIAVNVISQPELPTISQYDDILVSSSPEGNLWYLNGNPIAGATDQFIQITQTGTYSVEVNVSPCNIVTSANFVVSQLSINEVSNNFKVEIYPNPTNDYLHVKLEDNNINNLTLIDLQGRKILDQKVNSNSTQISLQSLPSAVYLLQISTQKGKKTVKVIKK